MGLREAAQRAELRHVPLPEKGNAPSSYRKFPVIACSVYEIFIRASGCALALILLKFKASAYTKKEERLGSSF